MLNSIKIGPKLIGGFVIVALIVERYLLARLAASPFWPALRYTTWACFAVAVFVSVRMSATDFIYFQF